jgi:CYTH domain-containing protein
MMDKTYRNDLYRAFLIEALPAPLTRASSHIQLFDNYIPNTRIRIRSIRVPETGEWTRMLQQRFAVESDALLIHKMAEIHLNDAEHAQFEIFEGNEIRKNRYFHEFDSRLFEFDVYLGTLWGLNRARVGFEHVEDLAAFVPPPFAVLEVTTDPFFFDENLVEKRFADIQAEVARLGISGPVAAISGEE